MVIVKCQPSHSVYPLWSWRKCKCCYCHDWTRKHV